MSAALAKRGAVIVDADAIAKELQRAGQPVFLQMVERYGPEIVGADGELDRARVAGIVFNDAEALKDLNAIVHPALNAEMRRRIRAEQDTDRVVIVDVALMAENNGRKRFGVGAVIVVDTPTEVAVERLVRFRGLAEADARARMGRQATREERLKIADRVVDNGGDLAHLEAQLDDLWTWIRSQPAAGPLPTEEELAAGGGSTT